MSCSQDMAESAFTAHQNKELAAKLIFGLLGASRCLCESRVRGAFVQGSLHAAYM